jgi:predicted PurR-regulated permease PerM
MDAPARREWRLAGIIFFSLIALGVLWATFLIIRPFVTPIILAAMLVTLTFRLYVRLRTKVGGRPSLAAILMLLGITFLLVLPMFVLALLLTHQASGLVQNLQTTNAQELLARMDLSNRLAFLHRWFPGFDPGALSPQRLVLPVVRGIPGWVARNGAAVVGGAAGMLIGFFLLLLACYFFYVEGEAILAELMALSPLPERYDIEFATQFKDVVDATFRGHLLTGLAQGIATMIGLLIARVPAALFWGSVATVISLLPFVGAAAVWVPAAIYLYASAAMGHAQYWQAIFLTIWGVAVVSVIDNVVRPWAMKGKAQLPAIPLLFAVLGGMQAFGFIGLVIGPLVFSLLMTILDIYKKTFRAPRHG